MTTTTLAHFPGVDLAYTERGRGQPVLFVHGYPLTRRLWQPQLDDLQDDARVMALDLRGHGESTGAGPNTMDTLADDCAGLLDALGISQPVVVCGLSMGGYVALAFYRRHAARLAGLVLAATRAGADTAEGKAGRDRAAGVAREQGSAAVADSMLPKMLAPQTYVEQPALAAGVRDMMASVRAETMAADLAGMRDRPDSTGLLLAIALPVLVLHGAHDQLIPPSEAAATASALPNGRLRLIVGAGHLLNLEKPGAFNAAVREYLASLAA